MLRLTSEQLNAADQGEAVKIEAQGKAFVLISQAVFDDELDFSPWSQDEIDLLADESRQLLAGDKVEEEDDS